MSLLKRFLFYFGGFAIGIIILYFFVGGSGASCDYAYGPTARTLKSIKLKERAYTTNVLSTLLENGLDTSVVSKLLVDGDVLFSKSKTDLDSCNVYTIEGEISEKNIMITVENCENKATVQSITIH